MEGRVCIYSKEMVHSKVSQYFPWRIKLVFFKANVLPPLYWYKAKRVTDLLWTVCNRDHRSAFYLKTWLPL